MLEPMTEAQYTEQRHLAENQAERLKIQQEIAKGKARAEVYCITFQKDSDTIHDIGNDRGCMRIQCVKGQQHTNNLRRYNDINVAEMMCKLVNQQSAPEMYIDLFGGNSMESHYFMAVFGEAVEKKIEDQRGKLTGVIKYTTGKVKEMVKICLQLPPKERCETAKQVMPQLYGDPQRVIAAYHKEIKQWPQIRPENAEAYRKLHNFLLKYYTNADVECFACS